MQYIFLAHYDGDENDTRATFEDPFRSYLPIRMRENQLIAQSKVS